MPHKPNKNRGNVYTHAQNVKLKRKKKQSFLLTHKRALRICFWINDLLRKKHRDLFSTINCNSQVVISVFVWQSMNLRSNFYFPEGFVTRENYRLNTSDF